MYIIVHIKSSHPNFEVIMNVNRLYVYSCVLSGDSMCSSPNFEILKSSFSQGTERQIYEFVVRHFLACCSKVWIYMYTSII